jgi:hypothetical protein
VINDSTIDLLRNPEVEAAVTSLHVKDRHLPPLRGDSRQGTVGIAEQQQRIGLSFFEGSVSADDHVADGLGWIRTGGFKILIGAANPKLLKEHFIQFVVVILAGVNQCVRARPIELVDEEPELAAPVAPSGPTQLRSQQQGSLKHKPQQHSAAPKKIVALGADAHRAHHDWKRVPVKTGTGACRVRSFHGKYSEQGLEYLDNAINEWLDGHPEVEVKFVTSTVMTFEGKIREPALVLNVWY